MREVRIGESAMKKVMKLDKQQRYMVVRTMINVAEQCFYTYGALFSPAYRLKREGVPLDGKQINQAKLYYQACLEKSSTPPCKLKLKLNQASNQVNGIEICSHIVLFMCALYVTWYGPPSILHLTHGVNSSL